MSRQKIGYFVGIVLLFLSFLFNGCSKKEAKEAKKISLVWSGYEYPEFNRIRIEQTKRFEELHPEMSVRYNPISGGSNYTAKILSLAVGGILPDIFFVPVGSELDFARRGILLDLTPYIEKDKEYFGQIPSYLINFMRYREGIYSMPGNLGVHCLFYNKKLFDAEGIPYPDENWTWNGFLEAAIKLTKRDSRGVAYQFGTVLPIRVTLIYSFGGEIWNKDRTKSIFNSPNNIKALTFYQELYRKYKVAPSPLKAKVEGGGDIPGFLMGRVAMFEGITADRQRLRFADKEKVDWGFVPIPKVEGINKGPFMRYLRIGVSNKTKHPDAAVELLKFIVGPEAIKDWIRVGDSIPVRQKGLEMEYFLKEYPEKEEVKETIFEILNRPNPVSYYNFYGNPNVPMELVNKIMIMNYDLFALGKYTPKEFAKKMEDDLNKLLEKEMRE